MAKVKIAILDSDGDASIYSVNEHIVEKIRNCTISSEEFHRKAKFLFSAETFNEGYIQ